MFDHLSRYHGIDVATVALPDGRVVPYVRRRFLPKAADLPFLGEVTVTDGERIDTLANHALGDPLAWWRICDANDAMDPAELHSVAGPAAANPSPEGLSEERPVLGVHLTILIGPTIPIPAPAEIAEAVLSVSVAETDEGRSGFQIVLEVGRAGPTDLRDYRLLGHPLLRPFNRVILVVVFDTSPTVLVDGFVTHHQFSPGTTPGQATLTLTGEDVSLMMDLEERRAQYPGHSDPLIVGRILAKYGRFGIRPVIVAPPSFHQPGPAGREPVQVGTDLGYLRDLARRHGLVFYVEPGPAPGLNEAYWGPAPRLGPPQRALAVNAGPDTNVESIDFAFDALAPTVVDDHVQDAQTHKSARVVADRSTRRADLAATPALSDLASVRRRLLDHDRAGLTAAAAAALAQAATNRSVDNVVTVEGALDAVRYGGMLRPRRTVVVRGAGYTNDGTYYVKRVSHAIAKGQYRQSFSLTREGSGASALAGIL